MAKRNSFDTITKVTPAMIEHWRKLANNTAYLKEVMDKAKKAIKAKNKKKPTTAKKTTTKKVSSCVKKVAAIRKILSSK